MFNKNARYNLLLIVAFLIGFSGLCYELVATKILFYFFSENSLSVSTVISIFLLGLGIGSYIFSKIVTKIKYKENFILGIQVLIAIYAIFVFTNFDLIPTLFNAMYNDLNTSIQLTLLNKFIISFSYLIIPTLLIGTSLPSVMALTLDLQDNLAEKISALYGVDLIGAVFGSFVSGYVFIPFFGLKALIFFTIIINLLTGAILICANKNKIILYCLFCIFTTLFAFYFIKPFEYSMPNYTGEEREQRLLYENAGDNKLQKIDSNEKLFLKNSPYGQVSVVKEKRMNQNVRSLYINNRMECSTIGFNKNNIENANVSEIHFVTDSIKEINRENLNVLNIGLGCGFTLSAIAQNPKVKNVDVVEINPVIKETSRFFDSYTKNVLKNKKVHYINNDGYYHLSKGRNKYDLIIVDIENPAIIESNKLYTKEFYEIVQKNLSTDGIFALWAYVPLREIQAINYRTLSSVFPYVEGKISGIYNDMYFFAKETEFKNISLKKRDIEFMQKLKNSKKVKINTLNNPSLTLEWMKTGLLKTDKY